MLGRAVLQSVSKRVCGIARFLFSRKKGSLVVCRCCRLIMDESDGVKVKDVWFCQRCFVESLAKAVNQVLHKKR